MKALIKTQNKTIALMVENINEAIEKAKALNGKLHYYNGLSNG